MGLGVGENPAVITPNMITFCVTGDHYCPVWPEGGHNPVMTRLTLLPHPQVQQSDRAWQSGAVAE